VTDSDKPRGGINYGRKIFITHATILVKKVKVKCKLSSGKLL